MTVIEEKQRIIQRWVEYFKKTLNKSIDQESSGLQTEKKYADREEKIEPAIQEIKKAIRRMKMNIIRSWGENSIIAEFIKYGGHWIIIEMHKLVIEIWETEVMPKSSKVRIICPIHKKVDKLACENYRGITLLSVAYKIFSSILNERVKECAKNVIKEYQCDFRPNRGTIDQLFVIKQMKIQQIWYKPSLAVRWF